MSIAEQLNSLMGSSDLLTEREMFRTGLTLAKVTNITDKGELNRVKCLPIGSPDKEETDWCYVMAPMGGENRGAFFFPQVDDLVVLAYLDGDPHRPLVLGACWNTACKPPRTVKEGKAEEYVLRTPKGIEIALQDTNQKQKVSLTMPSGTVLTLDDEKSRVTVQDKQGNNGLIMDMNSGEITLKARTKITIAAGQATLELQSTGDITQKGAGKISIQGTNVEVKSSAMMDLNASGPASLKGAVVKIN